MQTGGIDGSLTGPAGAGGGGAMASSGRTVEAMGAVSIPFDADGAGPAGSLAGGGALPDVADASQSAAPRLASASADDDWLTLFDANDPADTQSGLSTPWRPAHSPAGTEK